MTFERDEIEALEEQVADLESSNVALRALVLKVATEGLSLEEAVRLMGEIS